MCVIVVVIIIEIEARTVSASWLIFLMLLLWSIYGVGSGTWAMGQN